MNGFFGAGAADVAATWVAAFATLVVLGGLIGERRAFGWTQHLLAGLATGFLGVLAITELIVPRLVTPLLADPGGARGAWLGLGLVAITAASPWLPRAVAALPISIAIGTLAAFALGGAVIGTLLPQIIAAVAVREASLAATLAGVAATMISGLVLFGFVHGTPRGRAANAVAATGRWVMLGALGGWLGYLLLSRLILLLDRIGFLLGDWLGTGR